MGLSTTNTTIGRAIMLEEYGRKYAVEYEYALRSGLTDMGIDNIRKAINNIVLMLDIPTWAKDAFIIDKRYAIKIDQDGLLEDFSIDICLYKNDNIDEDDTHFYIKVELSEVMLRISAGEHYKGMCCYIKLEDMEKFIGISVFDGIYEKIPEIDEQ